MFLWLLDLLLDEKQKNEKTTTNNSNNCFLILNLIKFGQVLKQQEMRGTYSGTFWVGLPSKLSSSHPDFFCTLANVFYDNKT